MKIRMWPALILVLFLAGCAGGYSGYEPSPYDRPYYSPYDRPWYFYDAPPPLPVSPEVQGSLPGDQNPALSPWLLSFPG